jgi:hypothetical protein
MTLWLVDEAGVTAMVFLIAQRALASARDADHVSLPAHSNSRKSVSGFPGKRGALSLGNCEKTKR